MAKVAFAITMAAVTANLNPVAAVIVTVWRRKLMIRPMTVSPMETRPFSLPMLYRATLYTSTKNSAFPASKRKMEIRRHNWIQWYTPHW